MLDTLPLGPSSGPLRYADTFVLRPQCTKATERANQRSTKVIPAAPAPSDLDTNPEALQERTHALFVDVLLATGKVFSDQTGRFTTPSLSGNSYLMIFYDYNSNFIHIEALRSRTGPTILAAYQAAHAMFVARGLAPRLQRLDNEASAALLQFMDANNVDAQLTPPYIHRRNAAERAIRTF
jgi:hypothetical protein